MTAASENNTVTPTPIKSSPTPPSTPSSLLTDQAQDVPIFLRKTYHMVDTCDPAIACWSDDGETFVVKDPVKFEQLIIPQFFKHSKFSSFVRQLNFYAFRKIKYADTIRIDPKLEAETANYWRFRHEKFLRGKPELLGEIKRMNGQKQQQKTTPTGTHPTQTQQENNALKSEVTNLKHRIEAMTKNIDDLTCMVQKVTLVAAQQPPEGVNSNNKRTKIDEEEPNTLSPVPDQMLSAAAVTPATSSSSPMELDDFLPPSIPSPMPVGRTTTNSSELSDEGFVDQLFTAFKTEDFDFDESESLPETAANRNRPRPETAANRNRPRPELMARLSDALANLPRDIQELIVDRLIQAITSPKEIQDNISAANCLKENVASRGGGKALPSAVTSQSCSIKKAEEQPMGLPLAAATLAALLAQYGGDSKPSAAAKDHRALLVPVHA